MFLKQFEADSGMIAISLFNLNIKKVIAKTNLSIFLIEPKLRAIFSLVK